MALMPDCGQDADLPIRIPAHRPECSRHAALMWSGTPAAARRLFAVWRTSSSRITGTPASRHSRANSSEYCSGCHGAADFVHFGYPPAAGDVQTLV
jgi:hypothetical protein